MPAPQPQHLHYYRQRAELELTYAQKSQPIIFSAEFLRVFSPSAEVQGHGQPILQIEKKDVRIWKIEPVGHYALKLFFDDGHDSGLFSWDYLWHLAQNQARLWQAYLDQLQAAGAQREPRLIPLAIDAGKNHD